MRLETKWKHSFFLRPGGYQRSFICRAMYHAPILRRDIWDNCFVEVTGSGLASYPQPGSPQADSMVLFGAFCNFCVQKKEKKNCSKMTWMNVFLFMYMKMKRYRSVNRDVFCAGKDGKVSVFGGLLCLFLLCFLFLSFIFFTFLLSLLHHNETFSTNIHREPIVGKSSCRCNDEAKPFACTALCSKAWLLLGRQTWYCFLPPSSTASSSSNFWVLIALNVVTLQAKST